MPIKVVLLACSLNLDSLPGTAQDFFYFSIVQPQFCLHKWRLAPVFGHGGFAVPFGRGLLDA